MDINQAFSLLNLPINSSLKEIRQAHKKLIKDFHPRTPDENHDKAAFLNDARDEAVKYITAMEENKSTALIRQVVEVIRTDTSLIVKQNEYKSQSEAIYNKISREYRSKSKRLRSEVKLFGAIALMLTIATSNLLPVFEKITKGKPEISISFGIVTFFIAAYYNYINSKSERMQDAFDELKDILDDRANYFEIFNSILIYRTTNSKNISRLEFEKILDDWISDRVIEKINPNLDTAFYEMINRHEIKSYSLKDLARKIGVTDFTKLIISKGLEKKALTEEEISNDGFTNIGYIIN